MAISFSFTAARSARLLAGGLVMAMAVAAAAPAAAAFLPARVASPPPGGARTLCIHYDWACRRPSGAQLTESQIRLAADVNRRINRGVREISDSDQYGRPEVWALPTRRGGDCEDFALAKKRELLDAGLPPERLMLATALDRRAEPHAVLVLRTDRGDLVLDNLTDRMMDWRATGYRFLRMQNPRNPVAWLAVHGAPVR